MYKFFLYSLVSSLSPCGNIIVKMKYVLPLLLNLFLIFHSGYCDTGEIVGCGGFVRSAYKLDYDKIEIKL